MKKSGIGLSFVIAMLSVGAAAQDAENGEKIFKKCAACHQVGEGARNRVGPALTGVVGRAAGSVDGYKFSKSMTVAGAAGLVWDTENLSDYLSDPTRFLRAQLDDPGAKARMTFRLKKKEDRQDVIAYLASFSEGAAQGAQSALPDQGPVETAANAVCVRNLNSHEHLFAVDAPGADRRIEMLKPGEVLCTSVAETVRTGTVTVFEHADAFEGCSRLVPVGRTEDMLKYVDFDRCFWSSNT
ncbi:cytochrome c family protein [uncultured Roseovarius sp.]|uniref:c-type cytochrome n=1 Tax=uncultured Roseovarius sp. TaxID=293344 RepID=UPI00262A443F|nr:cytochrome c family protein [uncultured Roseovarius sp.]